ncbi:MAG: Uma2 family endonuclease [Crocosphaera sp.]|nr:Uma2 family endonuclease [Crocosphaera sp.]
MVALQLKQLTVPSGQKVIFSPISWADFEEILTELGENRALRLAYDHETLEMMTPLPEHEDNKEILGDLIKIILEELNKEFRTLGSTTFKHPRLGKGIEPDQCFYIENEAKIRGKNRLDLTVDPPPDLAIEIDITSRTYPDTYAALGVPELWRLQEDALQINILEKGQYREVKTSPNFPNIPLNYLVDCLKQSRIIGRNQVIKAFRQWVKEQLDTVT